MPPEVRIESLAENVSAWDEYAAAQPSSTFFHQRGWHRAIEATYGYRPYSAVAKRDGRVCGILPLHLVPQLPSGTALISIPWASYGGICADDEEVTRALLAHARSTAESLGVRYLELRNLAPLPDLPVKDLYVTFQKPIHPDAKANLAAVPRNQRWSVRQGEKHGLSERMGDAELLDSFYRVYAHSVRDLGTPVFPKRFFQRLLAEFGPACRIFAVERESRVVAATMTFFYRDQVIPYYWGALKSVFRLGVNDFMYWRLLCYGAEHGYRRFDYGRSKKGTGSYDFKHHRGFEPIPLPYQYYLVRQRNMPNLSPKNPRFSLAIQAWKSMPLWLAGRIGPAVVKYFP